MSSFPARARGYAGGPDGSFSVQFHLLGPVDFEHCQWLQRRLVDEAGERGDGRIVILLCEHPPTISVGRRGSRGHIHWTNEQLRRRGLPVRWIRRGGGCVLHAPGQLAVYPIVPLTWHGWTVGEYLRRLQGAVLQTLDEFRIPARTFAPWSGVWGCSGQLAAYGVAVWDGIARQGVYLNVNPAMADFHFVDVVDPAATEAGQKSTMGSLAAERRQALSMAKVRAALIPNLAVSLGAVHYHLLTGHPFLAQLQRRSCGSTDRAFGPADC